MIARALAAEYEPASFLMEEKWLAGLCDAIAAAEARLAMLNRSREGGDLGRSRVATGTFLNSRLNRLERQYCRLTSRLLAWKGCWLTVGAHPILMRTLCGSGWKCLPRYLVALRSACTYPLWLNSRQVIANNRLTRLFASGCYRNTLTLTVRGVYLTIHHESRRRNA